jgi:hypothetical protein
MEDTGEFSARRNGIINGPTVSSGNLGDGIRFGPKLNLAGSESPITQIRHRLVIKEDLDLTPFRTNAEGVPLPTQPDTLL